MTVIVLKLLPLISTFIEKDAFTPGPQSVSISRLFHNFCSSYNFYTSYKLSVTSTLIMYFHFKLAGQKRHRTISEY